MYSIYEKIEVLNLEEDTYKAIKNWNSNIVTIEDLIKYGKRIKNIRNIGNNKYQEIIERIYEKCGISIEKDISELRKLNLSDRTLNKLVHKYDISTIKELLSLSLNEKTKFAKEVIEKVHKLGLIFDE